MLSNALSWLAMPRHGFALVAFILGALGAGAIFLAILASVPAKFRKIIVMVVTFVGGLYYALEFLLPHQNAGFVSGFANSLTNSMSTVANIEMVVGGFALLLGIINLFQIHGKAIARRTKGWYNSAAFFIAFFSLMILGLMKDAGVKGSPEIFGVIFSGFLTSMKATMFSLVAFYIVSAAYRAFRIRSAEAALMMAAAMIVMLALVPVGTLLTSWLPQTGFFSVFRIERIGYWLLLSPNMAVQRAIGFGIAVGALATGLRIWLSLERGSFFDRQL